jgi:subtilisin family serine protease
MLASNALTRRCAIALGLASASLLAPATSLASSGSTELLVKFKNGVTHASAASAIASVGGRDVTTISDIGVHVVSVRSTSAAAAKAALKGKGNVAFAEADGVARPMEASPNNPYFPQGNLSLGGGAWGWTQTHATQAWDLTQGSSSVVIAVLDSGLKPQGLNFGSRIVPGYDVLNGTSDTATNAGNHGTYVAGTAVEVAGSASGNAGYCPGCSVMPVQVGSDSSFLYSDLATGITWATNHGAKIINMSLGGTTSSSTLTNAVAYARSKGVVLFAAAGNSNNTSPMYPAATPGVLGVAGVSSTGAKSGDSNYGSWVALAAPEGNMTAWPTLNGGPGYAQVGGTSIASPAAAGIAGLILSQDPSLTGAQLEQTLETTATAVPFSVGYGEVDAMAALRSLGYSDPQQATAPVNTVAPTLLGETNGAYNTAPLGGAPQVGQVLVRGQGSWTGSSPLSLGSVEWDRCNTDGTGCTAVGSASTYTVQSADNGYALRLKVTYTDPNGSTSAVSALSPAVGSSATAAPVNTGAPAISGTAQSGQTLTASTGTWSNSPTSYAYQWSRCDSTGANCAAVSGATASTYALGSADVGSTLEVTVTATNAGGSAGAPSAASAVVSTPPAAPVNTGLPTVSGTAQSGQTLTASPGTWSGGPTGYTYQWSRCSTTCTAVSGATSSTYALTSGDVGSTLEVTVTASNSGGSSSATSATTSTVHAGTQTSTFTGSLGGKGGSQSFTVTVGSGTAAASLSFTGSSSMTVTIRSGSTTVATATGPSVLKLSQSLAAGSYTYVVSGTGKSSFTLTVTSAS